MEVSLPLVAVLLWPLARRVEVEWVEDVGRNGYVGEDAEIVQVAVDVLEAVEVVERAGIVVDGLETATVW